MLLEYCGSHFALYVENPIKHRNAFELPGTRFSFRALGLAGFGRLEPAETMWPSLKNSFCQN